MNYPIIPGFKLDLYQEFTENKVYDESYVLDDNQNVFVPRYAPFFVESLKVYDLDGNLLTKDDYRIYRMMGSLSALCAAPVACLIEMINPNIKQVVMDYHQTGSSTLFDASFIELINNAANDQRLIKWSNIKNKPVVFDPIWHTHSLTYEITTFGDVVDMINEWSSMLQQTEQNYGRLAVESQTALVRKYFERNGAFIDYALARHKTAIDAHGLTKAQIGKGLVDNIPTSTIAEVLRGVPNQRLTPNGLDKLIERYGFNGDAYLKADVLPISFYGNTSFIPPTIGGSFEGLGSLSECAVFCTETDGTISMLSNHFDGQTSGLFFSIITGYPNTLTVNYQSYRYTHPVLTAAGVVIDTIAQSEGRDIMLIGSGSRWFVVFTNGTLNPAYHTVVEVDLSALVQANLTGQVMSIHLMGAYVVIIQAFAADNTGVNARAFYRMPTSALVTGAKVVPTRMNLTYTNADGDSFTNSDTFLWAKNKTDASGNYLSSYVKFNPPLVNTLTMQTFYRAMLNFCTKTEGDANTWLIKIFGFLNVNIVNDTDNSSFAFTPENNYKFDPATGIMTMVDYLEPPTIDPSSSANPGAVLNAYYNRPNGGANLPWSNGARNENGWSLMPDGNMLITATVNNTNTPHYVQLITTGATSPYDAIAKNFNKVNYPNFSYKSSVEVIVSPILSSTFSSSVSYDISGEFYNAIGQSSNSALGVFHRDVTGDYAVRDSFKNINFASVLSRPLSNNVRKTNISPLTPRVNLTGDAAAINTYGLSGLGLTVWSIGLQGKYYAGGNPGWRVPVKDESILMPIGVTLSNGSNNVLNITPSGYITYPKAIVDTIAAELIPAQYQNTPNYAAIIIDLTFVPNAAITSKPVLVQVSYGDVANRTRRTALGVLSVTYSTSGNDRIVTGYTVISKSDINDMTRQNALTATAYPFTYAINNLVENVSNIYFNGSLMSIAFNSYLRTSYTGNASHCGSDWDVGISDKLIKRTSVYMQNILGVNNISYVPKVGKGLKYDQQYSGGAANLVKVGSQAVGLSSCYPDPAWSVFFQSTTYPMFNGKTYTIPAGVIDLRTVKANPGNSTFYIYTSVTDGIAGYEISESKRYDTSFNIWIGTVTTNANQILNIARSNVLLLNGKRVSETKRGGAIPAVTGNIDETGVMHWVYPSEIIQS